ncbi:hypothetical protein [Flavisolibacter tropicus]|uniref:hypothetical protein n=1 Tax=Flavisolibacter tropicus TaxID=1492898 RepID=UPI0011DFA5D3|nr:hypothetical protein [Flavisolibacter tropicus]
MNLNMPVDQSNTIGATTNWLRILSPCVIAIAFCAITIIISILNMEESKGWSFFGIIIFLPASFLLWISDFILKAIFKDKVLYIWLIEILLFSIGLWYLYANVYG